MLPPGQCAVCCAVMLLPMNLQGRAAVAAQDARIGLALQQAAPHQLGGAVGRMRGWGMCLGVAADEELVRCRSALGNALARASAAAGLEPVGLVSYVEVCMLGEWRSGRVCMFFGGGIRRVSAPAALLICTCRRYNCFGSPLNSMRRVRRQRCQARTPTSRCHSALSMALIPLR